MILNLCCAKFKNKVLCASSNVRNIDICQKNRKYFVSLVGVKIYPYCVNCILNSLIWFLSNFNVPPPHPASAQLQNGFLRIGGGGIYLVHLNFNDKNMLNMLLSFPWCAVSYEKLLLKNYIEVKEHTQRRSHKFFLGPEYPEVNMGQFFSKFDFFP